MKRVIGFKNQRKVIKIMDYILSISFFYTIDNCFIFVQKIWQWLKR